MCVWKVSFDVQVSDLVTLLVCTAELLLRGHITFWTTHTYKKSLEVMQKITNCDRSSFCVLHPSWYIIFFPCPVAIFSLFPLPLLDVFTVSLSDAELGKFLQSSDVKNHKSINIDIRGGIKYDYAPSNITSPFLDSEKWWKSQVKHTTHRQTNWWQTLSLTDVSPSRNNPRPPRKKAIKPTWFNDIGFIL